MTLAHIDLNDPARTVVRARADQSRQALATAVQQMLDAGYRQIRFDQYRHPETGVMVETGYAYGEARLVVHENRPDYASPVVTDFRMVGGVQQSVLMGEFLGRAGCRLPG